MRFNLIFVMLVGSLSMTGQKADVIVNKLIVTQFDFEAGLQSTDITALFQDSRGIFWVGTRGGGLFQYNEGRFVTIPEISRVIGGDVTAICEQDDGRLLILTGSDQFLYDGRQIVSAEDRTLLCDVAISVAVDAGDDTVLCEIEQGMGESWIGTKSGLRSYNSVDSLWQFYSDALGLLNDPIQAFLYDNNDVLWIGTKNNGLLRYVGPVNETVDFDLQQEVEIVRYHPVTDQLVVRDVSGQYYTLTQYDGLREFSVFDSLGFVNFFVDGRGYYWLDRDGGNVVIASSESPDSLISSVNIDSRIMAFAYDRFNTIWIETRGGKLYRAVSSQSPGQYQLMQVNAALPADNIVELIANGGNQAFRRGNQVYRIGDRSVGIVRNDRYQEIYSSATRILGAYLDDSGAIWISTDGGEILILKEGNQPYELQMPAQLRGARILFLQKKGAVLWVGTSKSVYQMSLDNTLRNVIRGTSILKLPGASLKPQNYTVMGDVAICVTSGNSIYLLQGQGFTPQANTPRVFVSGVNLRDQPLAESKYRNSIGAYARQLKPLSLSYRENTLTLSWHGLNAVPGTLTYSYRLNPEDDWSAPSGNTVLQLAEIAPGNYLFDVKVCDEKGNCGTLDSPWQFEIRKALWQNWWFWMAAVIIALFMILMAVKYREKKIRAKAERDLQSVKSKLHTIELEQKAMQLQMNPHFIFNAIQTIHHQLLNNDVKKAANSLVSFSTLMRTMLEMSRTESVSLEDELEFLHAYVRVEQICRAEFIEFEVEVDDEIEPFDRMIPSMMLQPVLENAIQHGGPRISLQIKPNGKYLQFILSDNGPGFPTKVTGKNKSVALTLLRERVAHMPGNGFVKYYNIEKDGDVKGACVELNVI